MRFALLVPAAFTALLAAGSVMAENPTDDGGGRPTHRVERKDLERQAKHARETVHHRDVHRTATHQRNRVDRAAPRIRCGDDDCRVARTTHADAQRTQRRASTGRNMLKVDRAAERVNCSPDDSTCGSSGHAVRQHADRAKGDQNGREMTRAQRDRMRQAFDRMLAAMCERSGRDCGTHGE